MFYIETISVVLGITVFIFILILICNIPPLIRSRRLAEVAKELGLTFSAGRKNLFNPFFESSVVKRNVISGTIDGHSIEAYDFDEASSFRVHGTNALKHEWFVVVDGLERQPLSGIGHIFGLRMSVGKIKKYLITLK